MVMDDSGVGKRNVKRPILGTAILCTLAIVLTLMLYQNPQQIQGTNIVPEAVSMVMTMNTTKYIHWQPDWLNVTNIGMMLDHRKASIHARCARRSLTQSWHHLHGGSLYETRVATIGKYPRLQYSQTAKAASKFMNILLRQIDTNRVPSPNNSKARLVKYTTIRNPWHRLVSVYLQKFPPAQNYRPIGGAICENYARSYPTFASFVRECVITQARRMITNVHWALSVYRTNICDTKGGFDYIITTENLQEELAYILIHEGVYPDSETTIAQILQARRAELEEPNRGSEKASLSKDYQQYWETLTTHEISFLKDLWRDEIFILGYPESPFIYFDRGK